MKIKIIIGIVAFLLVVSVVVGYNLKGSYDIIIDDKAWTKYSNEVEDVNEDIKDIVKEKIEEGYRRDIENQLENECYRVMELDIVKIEEGITALEVIQ